MHHIPTLAAIPQPAAIKDMEPEAICKYCVVRQNAML